MDPVARWKARAFASWSASKACFDEALYALLKQELLAPVLSGSVGYFSENQGLPSPAGARQEALFVKGLDLAFKLDR